MHKFIHVNGLQCSSWDGMSVTDGRDNFIVRLPANLDDKIAVLWVHLFKVGRMVMGKTIATPPGTKVNRVIHAIDAVQVYLRVTDVISDAIDDLIAACKAPERKYADSFEIDLAYGSVPAIAHKALTDQGLYDYEVNEVLTVSKNALISVIGSNPL